MTLISTDNTKNQEIVKMFLQCISKKRTSQNSERYAILQEIYDSEEHFDVEICISR
jgi:Fur family ferric uptake transcriptional regulator